MARLTALSAALALVGACGGGGNDTPVTPVTPTIGVFPASGTVAVSTTTPGTMNISVTRGGGYADLITLTAEALPTGVTAAFVPASLPNGTTASVLTLTAGPTAVAGTTTITIRATGIGTVAAATATTSLTIPAASITLTAGATASTPQSAPATVPITIERGGPFNGPVTLSAENLPTGVTASFSPNPILAGSTTSTLTLTPGPTSVIGTNTLTVRASGGTGVTDKTAPIALTVTAPVAVDYSLSATPAAVPVVAGSNGTSTINITRTGGFAVNVTLALTGNPAGVTGTFAPNPTATNSSVLTIVTTGATLPGTYPLTITGTAAGITTSHTTTVSLTVTAAPAVTVGISPTSVTVAANASVNAGVVITRVGGVTGDVVITAEGLPPGVALTPLSITGTSTAGAATFTATGATVPGTYPVTLRGTNGSISGTVPFTLIVTAAQTIGVVVGPPSTVSVAQGATGALTANLTRTGGFTGIVNLAVTGLPTGVTTTITPAAVPGGTATASISMAVGSAVAAGPYTGTLTATATGLTSATTTFTLTVTPAASGGNIVFQYCDASLPLFFAVQDGTAAWTRVTQGANNTFTFSLTQAIGGVTVVQQNGATITTNVQLRAASEFAASSGQVICASSGTGRTVTGSVANVSVAEQAAIALGTSVTTAGFGTNTFTLLNVPNGAIDLVATRSTVTGGGFVPNKIIIRRGLTQAAGSVLPVLDFNAAEAFAPQTANITIANLVGETAVASASFFTATGGTTTIGGTATGNVAYGVPTALLQPTDFHVIGASSSDATSSSFRTVTTYSHALTDRTLTLGDVLILPNVTNVGTTTFRPRAQGTLQPEYNNQLLATFSQPSTNRSMSIVASSGYFSGATTYDLTIPDLFPIGYVTSWAPSATGSLSYFLNALGGPSTVAEGTTTKSATRVGTVTFANIRR